VVGKVRASIIGASGYTGGELLRLLLQHPAVEVLSASSERCAGRPVTERLPNLRGLTHLRYVPAAEIAADVDCIFLCTPHGVSAELAARYSAGPARLIDLSADFRLRDPATYALWYGRTHPAPELLEHFVYGLPELQRGAIAQAHRIAAPGCIATAATLALAPLLAAGLIDPQRIVVDAKIGSSGSGALPTQATHHPQRSGTVRAYKPAGHRHTAEIEQALAPLSATAPTVALTAHAVEMVRGILCTAHCFLLDSANVTAAQLEATYRDYYSAAPFVRYVHEAHGVHRLPEPGPVRGTNYCDIGCILDPHAGRVVVVSALDNLVKGAAGQAVQCLNLMCGLPETTGLTAAALHPA
jgi:LysW-gamma-L-alpha-aminoadipyl-6-phosphate/LysW-L-glutamyl-5-phosphate reductase